MAGTIWQKNCLQWTNMNRKLPPELMELVSNYVYFPRKYIMELKILFEIASLYCIHEHHSICLLRYLSYRPLVKCMRHAMDFVDRD